MLRPTGVGSGTRSGNFWLAMHVLIRRCSLKLALLSYVCGGIIEQASPNRSMTPCTWCFRLVVHVKIQHVHIKPPKEGSFAKVRSRWLSTTNLKFIFNLNNFL
ncbi:hypothetical protein VPH35_110453 [Triticum aestivum]